MFRNLTPNGIDLMIWKAGVTHRVEVKTANFAAKPRHFKVRHEYGDVLALINCKDTITYFSFPGLLAINL